jgi:hypothetical protein
MTKREHVEQQIREVLATEGQAIPLSNKLFRPDGLFNELANTEEERRVVTRSALFKQAQKRLMELQQKKQPNSSKPLSRRKPQFLKGATGSSWRVRTKLENPLHLMRLSRRISVELCATAAANTETIITGNYASKDKDDVWGTMNPPP